MRETKKNRTGGVGRSGLKTNDRSSLHHISLYLEEFRAHIEIQYGVTLKGDLKADGYFHGASAVEDKAGAKPFRYCVHLDPPQNVYFTDLKRGYSGVWFPEGTEPVSPAERERMRLAYEARRVIRETEIEAWQANAAAKARRVWREALPAPANHAYLVRKGVGAHGLRLAPMWERSLKDAAGQWQRVRVYGVLLVPMRDETGALWSVQAIFPERCEVLGRDKDFLPRTRKKGLFHWIGTRTETICLAEGYATAATIHEATGYRSVVCFDAGNLMAVAGIVREHQPAARIVICADNDLPDQQGRQAGQDKAHEAAALVGGFVALPPVPGADFNDWAQALREGK